MQITPKLVSGDQFCGNTGAISTLPNENYLLILVSGESSICMLLNFLMG